MAHSLKLIFLGLLWVVPALALDYGVADSPTDAAVDEWEGFSYEDVGLTQWEFQQVRQSGMRRDQLLHLLELGIRPSEYLQKPWERLGVTEEQWLAERSKGMEDSDIDRSYRNRSGNQSYAYWSILVPSLYQWKTGKKTEAISMNALWAVSVGAAIYLAIATPNNDEAYMIPFIAAVHVWSFADGFLETQWENNPDANRFSWGIFPGGKRGLVGVCQWRF